MAHKFPWRSVFLVCVSLLLGPRIDTVLRAEPKGGKPSAEQPPRQLDSERRKTVEREAKRLTLLLDDDPDAPVKLHPEPVLRWPNHERGATDGATFIWTVRDQPAAACCIWWADDLKVHLAFHSLTKQSLRAEKEGETIWHTARAGVDYRKVPQADKPASSSAARLNQMRSIARDFRAALVRGNEETEQLRLLPQPLFRYGTKDGAVRDGAIFAFVTGTDPEVFLQLEARSDETLQWQYAITRRTSSALRVRYRDEIVWTAEASQGSPNEPFFID